MAASGVWGRKIPLANDLCKSPLAPVPADGGLRGRIAARKKAPDGRGPGPRTSPLEDMRGDGEGPDGIGENGDHRRGYDLEA
jgi:hypothetical protein